MPRWLGILVESITVIILMGAILYFSKGISPTWEKNVQDFVDNMFSFLPGFIGYFK